MDNRSRQPISAGPSLGCETAPGSTISFLVDAEMTIAGMNRHAVDLLGCDSLEDAIEVTGGSFRSVVHKHDLDIVVDLVTRLLDSPGTYSYAYLRLRTKQGEVLKAVAHATIICGQGQELPVCNTFISPIRRFRNVDWLTGLNTMDRFHEIAREKADAMAAGDLTPVAVAFDFTDFKSYNDRYGRVEGDEALRLFARMLRDTFGQDCCAHFGADHFYALGEVSTIEDAVQGLLNLYDLSRLGMRPPVRAGLYALAAGEDIANVGFDRAKVASDQGRKAWRSHYVWFTDEMCKAELVRIHVLESLDSAIDNQWVRPYYQAVVRSFTNFVCGEEALARWVDPEFGFLSPAQFIPVIEEAGLSYRLDLHMVECVLRDIRTKQEAGISVVPVSVNFSVSDLSEIDICYEVSRRADALGVDHGLLVIEMTESAASSSPALFESQVARLRDAGFAVWMDDFGSGYSSLNTLQEFDFDLVKLDMGFVRGISGENADKARVVVKSILEGVGRMGLDTLAEGVETEEQARFLRQAGCDMLQGYLFGRPQPLEEILDPHDAPERERTDERAYWDTIGRIMIEDLMGGEGGGTIDMVEPLSELSVGVVEFRSTTRRVLKANDAYRSFLDDTGLVPGCSEFMLADDISEETLDPEFLAAIERTLLSGSWELIMGSLERGRGQQFYVRHLVSSSYADAFAIASVPVPLGSALGGFGDVPIAYAVFRPILNETRDEVVDTIFTYANERYRSWLGLSKADLVGHSFLETIRGASTQWFPDCYRATVLKEKVHATVYSPEIGHWLTYNIAPCAIEGYCVYTFSVSDEEHHEVEELTVDLDTSDLIIAIANAFSGKSGYDAAMNELLQVLSRVAHASRISIIERREHGSGVAFEWCDEGVAPLIDIMQNMDDAEFEAWDAASESEPLIIVPDVTHSESVDTDRLGLMEERGITRIIVTPLRGESMTLGYLVVDNYEFDDEVDLLRLLKTIGSFIATRMANHRFVTDLENLSLHDGLTNLLNRRGLDEAIERQLAERPEEPFALIIMDIDDFKTVNDLYGHDMGDEALRTLARVVGEVLPEGTVVGRSGGDEFLAMVVGCGHQQAIRLLEDLQGRDLSCTLDGRRCPLSISVGFTTYPDPAGDLMGAYAMADKALYAVKLAGKSSFKAYSVDMEQQMRSQLGFTPRDIADSIPAAVVVHRPDGELLFANDEAVHLLGCESLREFMELTSGSVYAPIHADDVTRVRRALASQLAQDTSRSVALTIRVISKGGAVRTVTCRNRHSKVESIGDVFYALICDDEMVM